MIDTDKYKDITLDDSDLTVEYQTARVEGFIPVEWSFEDYLLAEVKRLREGIKAYLDLEIETHELKEMIE